MLAFLSLSSMAQKTFQKIYGSEKNETASYVLQTNNEGYLILGSTEDSGSVFKRNILLIKTDSKGSPEWTKTYSGPGDEVAHCIQKTRDGGYIIAGECKYFSGSGVELRGFLIKINQTGDTLWSKLYGEGNNQFFTVKETKDGGYVVGGDVIEYLGNAWLLRVDSLGNFLWEKRFGGILSFQWTKIVEIVETKDSGYLLTGHTFSPTSAWVLKVNKLGDTIWSRAYPSIYSRSLYPFEEDCIFSSTEDFSTGSGICFTRVNANGEIVWNKKYKFKAEAKVESYFIHQNNQGNLVSALNTFDASKIYLLEIDSLGGFVSGIEYELNSQSAWLGCVQKTNDGGLVIAGWTENNSREVFLMKTNKSGSSNCNEHSFLVDTAELLGDPVCLPFRVVARNVSAHPLRLSIKETLLETKILCASFETIEPLVQPKEINIFPNPAGDILKVVFEEEKEGPIIFEFFDLLGRIVLRQELKTHKGKNLFIFKVEKIPKGTYFLKGCTLERSFARTFSKK